MADLRIVSLLPAATEIAFALGLGDAVVGVSYACDYPAAARTRPVVVRPALALENMSPRDIDVAVSERIGTGASLFAVDEPLLRQLQPDVILTQDLCAVCAPSGEQLAVALDSLPKRPMVLSMTPHSLQDILQSIRQVGSATGQIAAAELLSAQLHERLVRLATWSAALASRPRVFCMEWADPVYCAGHWLAQMIQLAGGEDALARAGSDSVRTDWQQVLRWAPQILIVCPCGYHLAQALEQLPLLARLPQWSTLPAVQEGRVFCVDADSYFVRPGPRVVEGAELLAHLMHPASFAWTGARDAYAASGLE